jgi:mannose-6-phosphate isomerase-like protein (cupin superfamily)
MKNESPPVIADEVQIFDVTEAVKRRDNISGRVDMAKSPSSFIAVFQTRPRGGEAHIHQHPDSDQILFVLKGEINLESLSGKYALRPNQGVLIPAGVHYGFINQTQEDAVFLTMRTESSGGRRVAYVKNVSSPVRVKISAPEITGRGIGRHIYCYAIDRSTIGISSVLLEEWNKKSLLRMHCDYEKSEDTVTAILPERLVQWYQIDALADSDYRLIPEGDQLRVRLDLQPLIKRQALAG